MKEVKLSNGKTKVKIKKLSLDEKNDLLDHTEFVMDNGKVKEIKMLHTTLTRYLRAGIDGDASDKRIMSMSMEDKVSVFKEIQGQCLMGEGNPSD